MAQGKELIKMINHIVTGPNECAFWRLGQMGFVLKITNKTIYIDPFLSDDGLRIIPSVLKPEEVTNADIVIGTHDHGDHIDYEAWKGIATASPNAVFVCSAALINNLSKELNIPKNRFIGLDCENSINVCGISIEGVPAAHELIEYDQENHPIAVSAILQFNGITIYHAGDSCVYEGLISTLLKHSPVDIMFVPINGRDPERYARDIIGNMTYQEATDLCGAVSPALAVPGHYDTHLFNLENPQLFAQYIERKYKDIQCDIKEIGEVTLYKK